MEINYVSHGIANNFGDYIEINENLKKYPSLHDAILRHELKHTEQKGFTKKDFLIDFGESEVNTMELFGFILKHPKSIFQLSPIYFSRKKIFFDINMMLTSFVFLGIISISSFLAFTL